VKGRPGVNGLRYYYEVDESTLATVRKLGAALGWWVTEVERGVWLLNPPGLHHTTFKYVQGDVEGARAVIDQNDREANLASLRHTRDQADLVVVQVHSHEWNPSLGIAHPPPFLVDFAHDCVDAGADLFVAEGSHAPLRGIEVYKGKVIIYDPGDLFRMSNTVERLPFDFYERYKYALGKSIWEALPVDGYEARKGFYEAESPAGGYLTGVRGCVVCRCVFSESLVPERVELVPAMWASEPRHLLGMPQRVYGEKAKAIIDHIADLSASFGTSIQLDAERGLGHVYV